MLRDKLNQIVYVNTHLGEDQPPNLDLVRLVGTDLVIGGHLVGSESLYRDIVASGVQIWKPYFAHNKKAFVIERHVLDAIQLWLESVEISNHSMVGYAGMPLRVYLMKILSNGETNSQEAKSII